MTDIPYADLQFLFLDVGNTLLSMDFDLLRDELGRCGPRVDAGALRRAESAARPAVSAAIRARGTSGSVDVFALYLREILQHTGLREDRARPVADELADRLHAMPTDRLWSIPLPGVHEALAGFRELGLRLVAVSNSDGTAERSLVRADLRSFFEAVHDSALVGFEKPDPRLFQHALTAAGARPEVALYIGDLYDVDVRGARSAGMHALLLDPHGDWQDRDCARARDLGELLEALRASS